jgi:probable HAF family extracellular repeat protein
MRPAETEMTKLADIRPKINRGRSSLMPFAVAAALTAPAHVIAQHVYQHLGTLPGGTFSAGRGISGDGLVVAGGAIVDHRGYPVRWTSKGIEPLMSLASFGGVADAASFDGSVITGGSGGMAFRWTEAQGMELLTAAPGLSGCRGWGISANGNVIVGDCSSSAGGRRAFRWTPATGMIDLGSVPGYSEIHVGSVSADGSVIAGTLRTPQGFSWAFRWTEVSGFVELPRLPNSTQCYATAISSDGRVVVGTCNNGPGNRAFRWLEQTGTLPIVAPVFGSESAYATNNDGSVVVGDSSAGAWIWTTAANGVLLQTVLGPALPSGHTVPSAWAVSHDGLAITGLMVDQSFIEQAYIARLAFLPCTANCDNSTSSPILNIDDFTCFINQFAAAAALPHAQQLTHYANCDGSTTAPALNIDDFTCFINRFAQGCP